MARFADQMTNHLRDRDGGVMFLRDLEAFFSEHYCGSVDAEVSEYNDSPPLQ